MITTSITTDKDYVEPDFTPDGIDAHSYYRRRAIVHEDDLAELTRTIAEATSADQRDDVVADAQLGVERNSSMASPPSTTARPSHTGAGSRSALYDAIWRVKQAARDAAERP